MGGYEMAPRRSVASIVGLVLGILALILSWMPIINNFSFVLGLIGLVFAIVGMVGTLRGTRAGKGLAIASLVINILSLVLVLATQGMYSAALDDAANGPDVVSTEQASDEDAAGDVDDATDEAGAQQLAVGSAVTLEDGLQVSVDEVATGLTNYDGSAVVGIKITYTNNGDGDASYNPFDWKGADAQGAAESYTYYSEGEDELNSGTLAAGGTVTGWLYFEGDTVEAL